MVRSLGNIAQGIAEKTELSDWIRRDVPADLRVVVPEPVGVEPGLRVVVLPREAHVEVERQRIQVEMGLTEGLVGGPPDRIAVGVREHPRRVQVIRVDIVDRPRCLCDLDGCEAAGVGVAKEPVARAVVLCVERSNPPRCTARSVGRSWSEKKRSDTCAAEERKDPQLCHISEAIERECEPDRKHYRSHDSVGTPV
jgi:hypothetical protein